MRFLLPRFNFSINFNFYNFRKIVSRTPIPKDDLELYYERVLKEIPQASYPTYDYSALREFLYPAYQQSEGMTRRFKFRITTCSRRNVIFTARNEVGARLCFYRCVWFCSQGVVPDQVHPPRNQAHPPGTRYPPDQVHLPQTRYTPWDQYTPGTRYTPRPYTPPRPGTLQTSYSPGTRYPPGPGTPPWNQVPPGPGTPQTRFSPQTRYTPRD